MSNVQPGTVMVDRYRLTSPAATDLAEAEAWDAQDQILDRPVRVTFVTGPNAATALDAARRAALVADPRLCRVLDVGSTEIAGDERSYVITEPYAGETLTQIVSRGLVDPQQARALVGEAAAALESARQRGVHHLALRPEAVRVDGHRVLVTGLGVDAGLAGVEPSDVDTGTTDTRGLVALGYYAMTARWPGASLEASWIKPDAVRPLPAQSGPDGVAPLSTLVPQVDPELDTLVRRTFGTGDDAPAGPGDIVVALEPWGQVSVMAALPQFVQPTPDRPVRASVLGTGTSATESRPGTPPPAPPIRRPNTTGRIARAGAVGAAGAGYSPGAPTAAYSPAAPGYGTPPSAPPPAPAYAAQPAPAQYAQPVPPPPGAYTGQPAGAPPASNSPTTGSFASTAAPKRRGVNPTPIVLGLILVAVVLAAVWAVTQAIKPFESLTPAAAETSQSAAPSTGTDASATPTEEETPEVRPIIDRGTVVALGDAEPDKAEAAELAYDSDPSTFWFTYTYKNNPVFGGLKEGLGFEIQLREKAPVSQVDLNTNSEGGHWELRSTTGEDPNGGDVLAEGSFSEDTAITLDEPVILDSLVLWITEVPTTDGALRLELNEITLS